MLPNKKKHSGGKKSAGSASKIEPMTPAADPTISTNASIKAMLRLPVEIREDIWKHVLSFNLPYSTSLDFSDDMTPLGVNATPGLEITSMSTIVSPSAHEACWHVLTTHITWRIKHTQDAMEWSCAISKMQTSIPAMTTPPRRISLVLARTDTRNGQSDPGGTFEIRDGFWPMHLDYHTVDRVSAVLNAFPDLTHLELVFELKTFMESSHSSYQASLYDNAIKNFWARSNESPLLLSSKIKDGLAGKTVVVNGVARKAPKITVILRVAGFESGFKGFIKTRTGTDYLEDQREGWEIDKHAEYHTRRYKTRRGTWLPIGTSLDQSSSRQRLEKKFGQTYREDESDITDLWKDLEQLVRKHYDGKEVVVKDAEAEQPWKRYGSERVEDFGRACFGHAVRRHMGTDCFSHGPSDDDMFNEVWQDPPEWSTASTESSSSAAQSSFEW